MEALHARDKICYVHFPCQSWPIANSTSSTLPFLESMRSQKQPPTSSTSGLTPEKQIKQPMHPGASGSQTAHKGSHLPPSQPGIHLHPHSADLEIAQSGGSISMHFLHLPVQTWWISSNYCFKIRKCICWAALRWNFPGL